MDKPSTDLINASVKRKSFLFPEITHFSGQILQLWFKDRFILKITCYLEENFTLSVQRLFLVITHSSRKKNCVAFRQGLPESWANLFILLEKSIKVW